MSEANIVFKNLLTFYKKFFIFKVSFYLKLFVKQKLSSKINYTSLVKCKQIAHATKITEFDLLCE